jgi:hypothetical protein
MQEGKSLDGFISFRTKQAGGNVYEKGFLTITSIRFYATNSRIGTEFMKSCVTAGSPNGENGGRREIGRQTGNYDFTARLPLRSRAIPFHPADSDRQETQW